MAYRTSMGLDVHARSVAAAAFIPEMGVVLQRSFPPDPWAIAEWARSTPQPAKCVYESSPTGFDLQRRLAEAGVECCVGAVSKMLRPPGDRVKTDKRDAVFLARMLAVGNISDAIRAEWRGLCEHKSPIGREPLTVAGHARPRGSRYSSRRLSPRVP